ncbi:MAG: UvrD-helicase domain-containing protein [Thermoplasmata archaeon]
MTELNEEQKTIIDMCKRENLRVNAVAGSGKTTTLSNAYMSIIEDLAKSGYSIAEATNRILVLTFTNDAAYDLKRKIYELLFERYDFTDSLTYVSTIHSFSNMLFNDLILKLKINPNYSIDDDYELEQLRWDAFQNVILRNRAQTSLVNEYFNIDVAGGEYSFQHLLESVYARSRQFGWGIEEIQAKFINDSLFREINMSTHESRIVRELLVAIRTMLLDYSHEVDNLKFQRGLFEFEDLVYYPYLQLKKDPLFRAKWSNRFLYILIDEYQDTSILQFEFIKLLRNNSRISLFGDYHQSIYEWRDASPGYMLSQPGFRNVSMHRNYRSGKNLINFVNTLFTRVFQGSALQFSAMDAQSAADSQVFVFDAVDGNMDRKVSHEAELFAKVIKYLVSEKHVEYRDITVLFRAKTHIDRYVREFQRQGIDYVLITNNDFFNLEEIRFMVNYLFFLGSKTRDEEYYYFARLIKAPVYGGDDTLLWEVAKHERSYSNVKESEIIDRFSAHLETLREYKPKKKDLLLLKLIELTSLDLHYLSRVNGAQKYANIYKFVDLVRKLEEARVLQYDEFLEALKTLIQNEGEGEAIINDKEDNAVKIMTVHANKGLQAKAILLPTMFAPPRPDVREYMFDREKGFLFNLGIINEDYKDLLKNIMNRMQKSEEEYLRLLYVAMTRAENYLIFSIDQDSRKGAKTWSNVVTANMSKAELEPYINASKEALDNFSEIENRHDKNVTIRLEPLKEQAKKLALLSPTLINVYLQCPRKYYYLTSFGTVSMKRESLKLGTKLHALLKTGAIDDQDARASELVTSVYNTEFWSEIMRSKNYRELQFIMNMDGTRVQGSIDLAYEHEGEWEIVDYKTASIDMELYRGQLHCYVLALYYLKSQRAKRIALYSIKSNTLVYEDAPEIEQIEAQIRSVIKDIEAERFSRVKSKICDICEFSELCKNREP